MGYAIEMVPDSFASVGKGPTWDVAEQSLYYIDIDRCQLKRLDFRTGSIYTAALANETVVGFSLPIDGQPHKFAIGCQRRVLTVSWDGISSQCSIEGCLFDVERQEGQFTSNRFNDGKVDPRGRLVAGTMRAGGNEFEQRLGTLYKYEAGGTVAALKTDVGISNGLAWNVAKAKMYFCDTADFEVKQYDYDLEQGIACKSITVRVRALPDLISRLLHRRSFSLANMKVIYNFRRDTPAEHLLPDGMNIDCAGNIYVATFNGSAIYKIQPDSGTVLETITLPCKQITSCCFGGPDMDILFVTTSARSGQDGKAGFVYKVTGLGERGEPMPKMKL